MSNADFTENFEKLNDHFAEGGALAEAYAFYSEDVWKLSEMDGSYYNLNDFAKFSVPCYQFWRAEDGSLELDTEKWQQTPLEEVDGLLTELYELNNNRPFMMSRDQVRIGRLATLEPETVRIGSGFLVNADGQVETLLDTSYRYWEYVKQWIEKGYMSDTMNIAAMDSSICTLRIGFEMQLDQPVSEESSITIPVGEVIYADRCEVYTSVLQSAPAKEAALTALNLMMIDEAVAKALYYGNQEVENRFFTGIDLLTRSALVPDEAVKYYDYASYMLSEWKNCS